uniref:Uncharacterized protein n=1 Tax=Timema genevievae TaxID=629358 RepID=A0A7R9JRK2_TIMGE|nr:unnamed protein product [Timema genevievae]
MVKGATLAIDYTDDDGEIEQLSNVSNLARTLVKAGEDDASQGRPPCPPYVSRLKVKWMSDHAARPL